MAKNGQDTLSWYEQGDGEQFGPSSVVTAQTNSPACAFDYVFVGGADLSVNVPTDAGGNYATTLILLPLGTNSGYAYLDGAGGYGTGLKFDPTKPVRFSIVAGTLSLNIGLENAGKLRGIWL